MPKRRNWRLPQGTTTSRMEAILRPAESAPVQIERLVDPEVAARILQAIGDIICGTPNANPRAWQLVPPNRLAVPIVDPAKMRTVIRAVPAIFNQPKDDLEALLRGGLPVTASNPSTIKPERFSVSRNSTEATAPITLRVNSGTAIAAEQKAMRTAMRTLSGAELANSRSAIPLGDATTKESIAPSTKAIMALATDFVAQLGDVPVQKATIFYTEEGISRPLY